LKISATNGEGVRQKDENYSKGVAKGFHVGAETVRWKCRRSGEELAWR